jgi:hypothetical protein
MALPATDAGDHMGALEATEGGAAAAAAGAHEPEPAEEIGRQSAPSAHRSGIASHLKQEA